GRVVAFLVVVGRVIAFLVVLGRVVAFLVVLGRVVAFLVLVDLADAAFLVGVAACFFTALLVTFGAAA
ncbi:hypothetical protein QM565_16045, partial [Geitlerinema splendidum]|nr:hypothetical protein [Geitlerinema splendidum]